MTNYLLQNIVNKAQQLLIYQASVKF